MKTFLKLTTFALLALALVGIVGTAGIQADPMAPMAPMAPSKPETPAARVDPNGPITDVRLGEILDGLGVPMKKGTYASGAHYYDVTVPGKDFDFNVRVGLSPNMRVIWMMAYLDDVPADAPIEKLRALLEGINARTGKLQFRLTGKQLKADLPVDNVAVTPARLRRELDDLATTLSSTDDLWNTKKWDAKAAKAEKTEKTEPK